LPAKDRPSGNSAGPFAGNGNLLLVERCPANEEKMMEEQGDILAPLPERRDLQADHIQPVVEVLPEFSPPQPTA